MANQAGEAGIRCVVMKPYVMSTLAQIIRKALSYDDSDLLSKA